MIYRLFLMGILATPLLAGCTFTRDRINDSDLGSKIRDGEFVVGRTTAKDIVRILGSDPQSVLATPNGGRVLVYTYGQTKSKGLTLLLFNVIKSNVGLDTAIFFLDSNGKLREHYVSSNSEDLPWQWWAFSG